MNVLEKRVAQLEARTMPASVVIAIWAMVGGRQMTGVELDAVIQAKVEHGAPQNARFVPVAWLPAT